jgi:hypothetical protein
LAHYKRPSHPAMVDKNEVELEEEAMGRAGRDEKKYSRRKLRSLIFFYSRPNTKLHVACTGLAKIRTNTWCVVDQVNPQFIKQKEHLIQVGMIISHYPTVKFL